MPVKLERVVVRMLCVGVVLCSSACAQPGGSIGTDSANAGLPPTSSAMPVALRSCGPVPRSSGPAAGLASVTLTVPVAGVGGSTLAVRATLYAAADGPRVITRSSLSRLLVVQDGAVLCGPSPSTPDQAVPVKLRKAASWPAQVLPSALTLTGVDAAHGQPISLPAGDYEVVAVVGYSLDALNSSADTAIGSPPPRLAPGPRTFAHGRNPPPPPVA